MIFWGVGWLNCVQWSPFGHIWLTVLPKKLISKKLEIFREFLEFVGSWDVEIGSSGHVQSPRILIFTKIQFKKKKIIQKVFFWTTKKIHFPLIATYSFWYSNFSTTKKFSPKEILKFSLIWLIESKLNLKNFVWND